MMRWVLRIGLKFVKVKGVTKMIIHFLENSGTMAVIKFIMIRRLVQDRGKEMII